MVWKKYQESENKEEVGENLFIFLKESEKKKKWGKNVILGEWKPEKVEKKIKKNCCLNKCKQQSIVHCTLCVKSVLIWSYSGSYFPTIGLNTERYPVSLCI